MLFGLCALFIFLHHNFWFSVSIIKKRNDIADIAWGSGFLGISLLTLFISSNIDTRKIIFNCLILLWSLRLSIYLFFRSRNQEEDSRYKKWRNEWGKNFILRSYLQVYLLQGFLLYIIAVPIIVHNYQNRELHVSFIESLGLLFWLIGFYFESVADCQLYRFKKKQQNKGKLIRSGLWKYSRHPNYFGEVLMWWGIFFWTIRLSEAWWTIISPITITLFILFISGIPLLENKYKGRADFKEYCQYTSIFFPWPPKKDSKYNL